MEWAKFVWLNIADVSLTELMVAVLAVILPYAWIAVDNNILLLSPTVTVLSNVAVPDTPIVPVIVVLPESKVPVVDKLLSLNDMADVAVFSILSSPNIMLPIPVPAAKLPTVPVCLR